MKTVANDPKVVCKLLRAIANSEDAKRIHHDVIFNVAADMIEAFEHELQLKAR